MTSDLDRIKPVKFPTVWLTYKGRIRRDLDRDYAAEGGVEYFNSDYFDALSTQVKQLEDWVVKLLVVQIAITGFQIIGFVGNDASISLFGVTLKQATGVKEIVISLYALVAVATWMVLISRDTSLAVLERLVELRTKAPFVHFGKLSAPTSFNLKFYTPRAHEDWIFPTLANRIVFGLLFVAAISIAVAIYACSIAVNVIFFLDIYRHPTLGTWSNWILVYVSLTLFFGIMVIIRFYLPQPYRDQSLVLALKQLESGGDPVLYRRRLAEIYGEYSKYRKYRLSYRAAQLIGRCKNSILSALATAVEIIRAFRRRWLLPPWQYRSCEVSQSKSRKGRPRPQQQNLEPSPRRVVLSLFGPVSALLGLGAAVLALWDGIAKTEPLVTPQAMESSSSVLHFKIENPSFIFDMNDVTLACQVLRIETGPASAESPVTYTTSTKHGNGRVLSEKKHFAITYRHPTDFECGAGSVFQMEKGGVPYHPPRIEIEILVQFKTLGLQRKLVSAGPFVAVRTDDKYQWREGTAVTVEPIH